MVNDTLTKSSEKFMNEENKGTETKVETIPTPVVEKSEAEVKIEALESEKAKLIEEKANYKLAYLKEASKNGSETKEETEEEKIQRIVDERLANTRISEIDKEREALNKKLLQENKELKLAVSNKTTVVNSTTSSTEFPAVKDTLITADQMSAFKARGWTDKDIERYKKNYLKYGGR